MRSAIEQAHAAGVSADAIERVLREASRIGDNPFAVPVAAGKLYALARARQREGEPA